MLPPDKKKKLVLSGIVGLLGIVFVSSLFQALQSGKSNPVEEKNPYFPDKSEAARFAESSPDATPTPIPSPTVNPAQVAQEVEKERLNEQRERIIEQYKVSPQAQPTEEVSDFQDAATDGGSGGEKADILGTVRTSIDQKIIPFLTADKINDEQLASYLYGESSEQKKQVGKTHEELIDALLLKVNSVDTYIGLEAGVILRKAVGETDAQRLSEIVSSGGFTEDSRVLIIDILGKLHDRRVFKTLYDEMKRTTSSRVRDAVIVALGYLGDERAIPPLVDVANKEEKVNSRIDTADSERLALVALGRLNSPRAKDALRQGVYSVMNTKLQSYYALAMEHLDSPVDPKRVDTMVIAGQKTTEMYYKGIKYLLYVPTRRKNDTRRIRALVCVHGQSLQHQGLFEACREVARKSQFAVIAPFFDPYNYQDYGHLNMTGPRADLVLWEILEHLKEYAALDIREIYLYGEGRGGEFVQSMTLAYPDRIGRALFESYEIIPPDPRQPYPLGTGITPLAPDLYFDLDKYIKSDIALMTFKGQVGRQHRPAVKEFKQYLKIAEDNGVTPRLGIRESQNEVFGEDVSDEVRYDLIQSFLFEGL